MSKPSAEKINAKLGNDFPKTAVEIIQLSEAKKFAKIVSQQTAQDILSFIAEHKSCTASEVAKGLNIPLSTAHYNLKALTKAKIIDDESFHYSSKGKEVSHYEIAKKIIVIVPKKEPTLLAQLTTLLPGFLMAAVVGTIALGASLIAKASGTTASNLARSSSTPVDFTTEHAPMLFKASEETIAQTAQTSSPDLLMGIIIGVSAVIAGLFLFFGIKRLLFHK
ncbi:helix-turn-helix domain-containing protein [Candidatus Woesearchaeota archaeon]|nr:helix-turn-helix domain-containing protein [Candidatus Woesearchaeota archaeon]